MSPIRHEDDFRRTPIDDWESYIEDAITQAQKRGEFDNLPGAGKPIRIESNPHAPDLDFAMSRLKNAGYKPSWMELDEEIKAGQRDLQGFLDRSVALMQAEHTQVSSTDVSAAAPAAKISFWRRLLDGPTRPAQSAGPRTLDDIADLAQHVRRQYLERSAALDKRIADFNASLSRELWHLERMRLPPSRAVDKFNKAMSGMELSGVTDESN
ncbi:MAG: DUF1992 domain-containing protein [Thermomicrobiales bacterium]